MTNIIIESGFDRLVRQADYDHTVHLHRPRDVEAAIISDRSMNAVHIVRADYLELARLRKGNQA